MACFYYKSRASDSFTSKFSLVACFRYKFRANDSFTSKFSLVACFCCKFRANDSFTAKCILVADVQNPGCLVKTLDNCGCFFLLLQVELPGGVCGVCSLCQGQPAGQMDCFLVTHPLYVVLTQWNSLPHDIHYLMMSTLVLLLKLLAEKPVSSGHLISDLLFTCLLRFTYEKRLCT